MPPRVGEIARRTRRVSVRDIELFTEITGDRTAAEAAMREHLTNVAAALAAVAAPERVAI